VRKRLSDAGAHAVIDALSDLPGLIAELGARRTNGERP
jgi:hypothetical protein